ncbi:2-oxo-tetronate isomerase [Roseomonas marmotae]|uniref:Hydroxypyruvate isomerase family protein n=1 Tax=Roseomonas marmotae TaxID=2768161 RepID=A0ABS3KAL1_9PROT|nr:2-oxo-tetronate isomerase [Roseomonas marmotae]MBO1074504.1 hydroxypyruvate isomerase family protein [Roseomonas marmotae]QTI78234.1 hydroxypyruvate isomerase family protein [Roseomonas marmotae]
MPRFAANLSMMFQELPFLSRFAAARAAGFAAVEFLFPYEFPAAEIARRLADEGLSQVLFNAPPGDPERGERGTACLPGRQQEFRDGVLKALEYAATLSCPRLHLMAGLAPAGVARDTLTGTYAANLAWAAEECAKAGVKPLIEPINHRDIPGIFLNTTDQAAAIIAAVGPERLGLQFDLYHCQVTEGDIVKRVEKHLPIITHMQVADVPGRNEPGTGEVKWPFVFSRIDALGYRGWIGCEYRPAGETVAGLGWFAPYRN